MEDDNDRIGVVVASYSELANGESIGGTHDVSGTSDLAFTQQIDVSTQNHTGGATTSSTRDGPAIDEKDGFDSSTIPMITTSPSKHGSNLNAYMDVCHNWIDAELQNTTNPLKSLPPTTLLDAVTISPMRPLRGYDNAIGLNDHAPTDEDGDLPLSFLNCSSDSSTGPPPPPPPLVPVALESEVHIDSMPNGHDIEPTTRAYDEHRDLVEQDDDDTPQQFISTGGMDVSPFDEITEATLELDTTIDTATAGDGTMTNPSYVAFTAFPLTNFDDEVVNVVLDNNDEKTAPIVVDSGIIATPQAMTEQEHKKTFEIKDVRHTSHEVEANKDTIFIEHTELGEVAEIPLVVEGIGDTVIDKAAAEHQLGTNTVTLFIEDLVDVKNRTDVIDSFKSLIENVPCDVTDVITLVDHEIKDADDILINVDHAGIHTSKVENTTTEYGKHEPFPDVQPNDLNTTSGTGIFVDCDDAYLTNVITSDVELHDAIAETTSTFEKTNQVKDVVKFDEPMMEPFDELEKDGLTDTLTIKPVNDEANNEALDGLMVELIYETVFVGDVETPHDKEEPTNTTVPFLGNIMSPSAERDSKYPLDEEVLNMTPTELEALVNYVKLSSYSTNEFTLSLEEPKEDARSIPSVSKTELFEGTMNQDTIALDVPLTSLAVSTEDVLLAVDEFTMPIASDLQQFVDLDALIKNTAKDGNSVVVQSSANDVLVEPDVDHDTTGITGTVSHAGMTFTSLESSEPNPDSRSAVIHNELESIEQMIQSPDRLKNKEAVEDLMVGSKEVNKKTVSDRDIMFEHLWKETTCECDKNEKDSSGVKSHIVSGNMDFLSTRKGLAYVDYAKRTASKFQKAKEEILNDVELDKAASLSHVCVGESSGYEHSSIMVNTDVEISEPVFSPMSDNELVRVPTTEETKVTSVKAEPVSTTCMETCVLM